MGAILRVSRSRQHALTTALRVDMAYLCVGERTVFSLLLAPLFSVIFQGEVYGDGFGYRMGVIMTVFTCAMWVLTMAVADLQNGYRLRGIIPASRKNQVAARYVVGLVISVLSIAMIVLIDGLQVLVNPDWSFAGNLWAAPLPQCPLPWRRCVPACSLPRCRKYRGLAFHADRKSAER